MTRHSLSRHAALALMILGVGSGVSAQPGETSGHKTQAPSAARIYATACAPCHDNGGFAVQVLTDRLGAKTALIDRRNTLDAETIRFAVRHGMGAMPAMSKLEVTDAELDGIIAYLAKARTSAIAP